MARFTYDKEVFEITTEKVFREDGGGALVEDGAMAEVRLLDPANKFDPIPVTDGEGHVIKFPNAEAAEKGAMQFVVKTWERKKPKPRLPVGTRVYVASRNAVGKVVEENMTSKYFRVAFADGSQFDIHEKDLTPVRF